MELLTQRQYAAVLLQVADSGEPWLDGMIREAQSQRLEALAMLGLMIHNSLIEHARTVTAQNTGSPWGEADIAVYAREQAGAMLAGQQSLEF